MQKHFLLIIAVVFCKVTVAQENFTSSPVIGTWQFIAGSYTTGTNKKGSDSSKVAQFKVITPNWFMFTTYDKTNGNLLGSSAGKIIIDGKQVTHIAQYSGANGRIGIPATYTMDVKQNILHQKGLLGNMEINEYWVRIY